MILGGGGESSESEARRRGGKDHAAPALASRTASASPAARPLFALLAPSLFRDIQFSLHNYDEARPWKSTPWQLLSEKDELP